MKKSVVISLVVLSFVASQAFATGQLIFEGPDDRGESDLLVGTGTVVIDVYALGITGVAGIQSGSIFLDPLSVDVSGLFQITRDISLNQYAVWDYQIISLGSTIPDTVFPVWSGARNTAGFMPLAGNLDFVSKTLLYSVTYDYNVSAIGTYTIDGDPALTIIGDALAQSIAYNVTAGSVTFIPEPTTMLLLALGAIGLLYQRKQ